MQITNNLQIPIEAQLAAQTAAAGRQEMSSKKQFRDEIDLHHSHGIADFTMVVKPESSVIVPLKACSFGTVQIRPIIPVAASTSARGAQDNQQFEWS